MPASRNHPILVVKPRDNDLKQRVFSGFGGPVEIVPVDNILRRQLNTQVSLAAEAIAPVIAQYGDLPAVVILKLRPKAMAKSHRPKDLLERVGMSPIGTRRFGEWLLPATPDSLANLARIIDQNQAATIKANISTIETLSAYTADDALQRDGGNDVDVKNRRWIRAGKAFILERFASDEGEVDEALDAALVALLEDHEVETLRTEQHGTLKTTRLIRVPTERTLLAIASFPGARAIVPATEFAPIQIGPQWFTQVGKAPAGTLPAPAADLPTVGVVDTGVAPRDPLMQPWVAAREPYLLQPDTDFLHGTFVSGLIAGSRALNGDEPTFPAVSARILDVAALSSAGNTGLDDMLDRISECVRKYPDVKVWNCSFGTPAPSDPNRFGYLARELDQLADRHGVLFVIAAGNYTAPPLRPWPNPPDYAGADRVSEPGESTRALTVGSVAHHDALVEAGDPSPFSRRGPGPAKTPKPDITHYGGNCDAHGVFGGAGVRSVLPAGIIGESIGTSFATPLAAALAANVWQVMAQQQNVRPDVVKALMIHAAALASPARTPEEHNYHGFGVPESVLETLFCSPESFTLFFDAELFDGQIWEKTPFPIPACLHPDGTHFRGEILLTLVYSPPVDGQHGAEYVRANVNAHFGTYDPNDDGELVHRGILPLESPDKCDLQEETMIEHGFKWSPVKVYRKAYRRGKAGRNFRLYLELLRRAGEPARREPQRAVVLVTLRGVAGETEVYNDGVRAVHQVNWVTSKIAASTRVRA